MSLLPRRKSFLRNRNRVNVARAVLRFSAKTMDNDDNTMDNDDSDDASDVKETTSSSLLSPLYTAVRVCVDNLWPIYLWRSRGVGRNGRQYLIRMLVKY
jgi:hypothetical protein